MRFDDTLETVLAGDLGTPFGMQSAWRQLVDLIGRRRVPPDTRAISVLRRIRPQVPPPVRQASARGLEFANPPVPLVRLFALDELPIALPVLRSARMASADWLQLLPDLTPSARAIVRNRRDLSPVVRRALDTYGPIDFVLPDESRRFEPEIPEAAPEVIEEVEAAIVEAQVATVPEQGPADRQEATAGIEEVEAEASVTAESIVEAQSPEKRAPRAPEPQGDSSTTVEKPARAMPPEQLIYWTQVLATPTPSAPPVAPRADAQPLPEPMPEESPSPEATWDTPARSEEGPAVAPQEEPVAPEDLSFIALAGFSASLPNPTIVPRLQASTVQSGTVEAVPASQPIAEPAEAAQESEMAIVETLEPPAIDAHATQRAEDGERPGPFQISEVVARIDAFWRDREEAGSAPPPVFEPARSFRFETDAKGVVRWVDGVSRAPLVGLSLDHPGAAEGVPSGPRIDAVAVGAFRRRAGFSNARLEVDGDSDAAGDWLISAIPVFDPANGRFTGYRGTARRPRVDERAEPARPEGASPADSLRQLVHELRTPTNAIAGFAEMIEAQMLGPVAEPYRDRAGVIRGQAKELLGAIDDLDLAARIDSAALTLVPAKVALRPLLAGIADDLAQLAALRGAAIALPVDDLSVEGDRRAVERLLARLMATLVSASGEGERIGVRMTLDDAMVAISIDRPRTLADYPGESVLGIDDELGDATLLGTGFALRLARNLARELGGGLVIEPESLTLRLPAAVNASVGQAHLS